MHGICNGGTTWRQLAGGGKVVAMALSLAALAAVAFAETPHQEGAISYIGAQKDIVASGKADSVINLQDLAATKNLFAIGPVAGLDGEITIFNSQPYVSQVRGDDFEVHHSLDYGAIFLVWSAQAEWQDIPIPATVKSYLELQDFVKSQAQAAGIDTGKSFAFLLSGTPADIKYHINVDRTEGQAITKVLFLRSKAPFALKNEPVDILGFYSENHPGVFLPNTSPAIKAESGRQNAMHIHVIAKTSKATGHIDDLTLGEGMVLRLPKN